MPAKARGTRPIDPSEMTREALVAEVRQLRADQALACHLTDVVKIDEASARRRLAILESALAFMPVGFGLYDAEDRLVFKNNRFQLFDNDGERDRPGTRFEDIVRFGIEIGNYPEAMGDPEAWVAERLFRHAHPRERIIQRTRDGRHIQIEERRLDDGCTVATYTDVSQIKDAEETVDRALQEATRASKSKSVFLANMSHELRTPLNAIIGFAQVLLSPAPTVTTETKRQEYLQDILDAARHLLAIISDILDISRVEAGRYKIVKQSVDVLDLCQAVHRMFEVEADQSNVAVSVTADDTEGMTWQADPRALQQMLINLLANSLRHTPPEGRIDIAVRRTDDALSVIVADNGSGIPAEELQEVVKPFHRGKADPERGPGGLGLGLALTSMLMDLHGGELRLDSNPGAGTTATLWFPRALVEDEPG